jgi:hypothetical protein
MNKLPATLSLGLLGTVGGFGAIGAATTDPTETFRSPVPAVAEYTPETTSVPTQQSEVTGQVAVNAAVEVTTTTKAPVMTEATLPPAETAPAVNEAPLPAARQFDDGVAIDATRSRLDPNIGAEEDQELRVVFPEYDMTPGAYCEPAPAPLIDAASSDSGLTIGSDALIISDCPGPETDSVPCPDACGGAGETEDGLPYDNDGLDSVEGPASNEGLVPAVRINTGSNPTVDIEIEPDASFTINGPAQVVFEDALAADTSEFEN